MADWDFVIPDEEVEAKTSPVTAVVEMRPNRMGLGCSREDIQQKISENAKRARLSKLLGRKDVESDGLKSSLAADGVESDSEFSKSHVKKAPVNPTFNLKTTKPMQESLTKTQRKRMKRKQKQLQNQLVSG